MAETNFIYAVDEALAKASAQGSAQQMQDTNTAEIATQIQANLVEYWTGTDGPLDKLNKEIETAAADGDSSKVTSLQTEYETQTAEYNAQSNEAGGLTSACSSQLQSDGTNQSQMANFLSTIAQLQSITGTLIQQQ